MLPTRPEDEDEDEDEDEEEEEAEAAEAEAAEEDGPPRAEVPASEPPMPFTAPFFRGRSPVKIRPPYMKKMPMPGRSQTASVVPGGDHAAGTAVIVWCVLPSGVPLRAFPDRRLTDCVSSTGSAAH